MTFSGDQVMGKATARTVREERANEFTHKFDCDEGRPTRSRRDLKRKK